MDAPGRGPVLRRHLRHSVTLASGETIVADDAYIRESILSPAAKVVAGYQPVMPTFQGQVSEEQLLQLIAYIKSLRAPTPGGAGAPAPADARAAPSAADATSRMTSRAPDAARRRTT